MTPASIGSESILNNMNDREKILKEAKIKALHILERMDRTEAELTKKLKDYGYSEDIVILAVSYVKSYGYIDDRRYAETYVRLKQYTKSKRQIQAELIRKGVDSELISDALTQVDSEAEVLLIEKLLQKKHYDPESADDTQKRRVYQYLGRKGFSLSEIRRCMKL